jgi:hypothetical protein
MTPDSPFAIKHEHITGGTRLDPNRRYTLELNCGVKIITLITSRTSESMALIQTKIKLNEFYDELRKIGMDVPPELKPVYSPRFRKKSFNSIFSDIFSEKKELNRTKDFNVQEEILEINLKLDEILRYLKNEKENSTKEDS